MSIVTQGFGGTGLVTAGYGVSLVTVEEEAVTTAGGVGQFFGVPSQEALDRRDEYFKVGKYDPARIKEKVEAKPLLPSIEGLGKGYFEDLVGARKVVEWLQAPLMPSEIEKIRDGYVSIDDLLSDYDLDEMDEEAIVLLMMMRM